jgi:hypothetical protein
LRFEANRRKLVRADQPNFARFFTARRKAGSLQGAGRHSPIHRLLGSLVEPLTDPKRRQLRRPFDRQIDPIQQGLGA